MKVFHLLTSMNPYGPVWQADPLVFMQLLVISYMWFHTYTWLVMWQHLEQDISSTMMFVVRDIKFAAAE